ncbi:hypothetical protein BDB00DRAFT_372196 [Zychaea mexicana]|uniref:uncharacterized protein n=1 Tax=Zychaea mexicana TaxID=64656 RepID=UPI0022FF3BAA|nr:uncharacterized protein BDB00DRAFT_372196 [Zychaea mexicana]KAI9493445.1 hypothetical protein BDB00DRAFT_372196 [Zychaea mexicana]
MIFPKINHNTSPRSHILPFFSYFISYYSAVLLCRYLRILCRPIFYISSVIGAAGTVAATPCKKTCIYNASAYKK